MRPVKRPFHQTQTPSDPPRSRQRLSGPAAATTPADPAPTSSADAPPDSRPSRRPSSGQLINQMVNFAPDVWDKIASYDLSEAEITRMSKLTPVIKSGLKQRLQSKRYAHQASQINSLAQMNTLLQEIGSLRQDLKWEPLYEVMLRLRALPPGDQAAGFASYRAAVDALPLEHHPCELDLIFTYPDSRSAIEAGQRVDTVARLFNMTSFNDIRELERYTTESSDPRTAGGAIRAGGHVRTIAQKFGITSDFGIFNLEWITTRGPEGKAWSAMIAGGNVLTVAQQFGVSSINRIEELELATASSELPGTAGAAVIAGGQCQTVAEQFGITSTRAIKALESAPAKSRRPGTAGAAMIAGGNVKTVAQQFGITSETGIVALELVTTDPTGCGSDFSDHVIQNYPGTAQAAMISGGKVQTVAQQFGITSEIGIEKLECATAGCRIPGTAGAAMIAGGKVQTVAQQFGITSKIGIKELECATADSRIPGTAGAAMIAGGSLQTVMEDFGITSEDAIGKLYSMSYSSNEPGTIGFALRTGANLQTFAHDFGLPSTYLPALECNALLPNYPANRAILAGGNVISVARQFGFTVTNYIMILGHWTIYSDEPGTAGAAIRNGADVQTVAQQFGITLRSGLESLERRFSSIRG